MARKTKIEKIKSLDEQIRELEQKKKEVQDRLYTDVGKYVVTQWECEDDEVLKSLIDKFKNEVLLSNGSSDTHSEVLNNEERYEQR
ncbi:hypothetical protein MKX83_23975 [Cytobacillus sp. FSL M8-0252]|uniref:hypothetical protein n=1 Tax=Cytobacillus sp. FSL M8-0252 TaxID=2921621 RepID=UPI0030F9E40E